MMKKMMKWCLAAFTAVAMIMPATAQDSAAQKFDDTVKHLDKGGLALEYLDAGTVINGIIDIVFKLTQQYCTDPDEIKGMEIIKDALNQSGLPDIRGYGSSLMKNGNTYTAKGFLAIDQQKRATNLFVNLFTSRTAGEMAKFVTAKDAIALSVNLNGAAIWNLIDHNAKKYITTEQMQTQYAMALAQVQGVTGMEASQLFSSLQGAGLFVKTNKKADGTQAIPTFTILIDMKEKAVCDKLAAAVSAMNPQMFQNGKMNIPVAEYGMTITIGMTGKYGYITNDPRDLDARLAQQLAPVDVLAGSKGKPAAWCYIAPTAGKELLQILAEQGALDDPEQKKIAAAAMEAIGLNAPTVVTSSLVPEGFLMVCKTNSALLAYYYGSPRIQGFVNSLISGGVAAFNEVKKITGGKKEPDAVNDIQ